MESRNIVASGVRNRILALAGISRDDRILGLGDSEGASDGDQKNAALHAPGRAAAGNGTFPAVSNEKTDEKPESRIVELKGRADGVATALGTLTAWKSYSYAPEWFAAASREAGIGGSPGLEHRGARMREVLFAACAAESYIFEWVRDTVLNHDYEKLKKYFPAGTKRGVVDKLKEIPKQLHKDGTISGTLDCGGQEWRNFQELVDDYRDGLVHASASRPETDGQPENERPVPAAEALDALPPGWALGVVRVILRKLHTDTKTTPIPAWLS